MGSQVYSLIVDDTSPIITFLPPTLGPNTTDQQARGWVSKFDGVYLTTLGEIGLGNSTSIHQTSLDGANFQLNFVGNGITLLGSTTKSTFDIVLDGLTTQGLTASSADVLFESTNLSQASHSLTLVAHPQDTNDASSSLSFDKAIVQVSANGATTSSSIIPDTFLNFVGAWTFNQIDPASPLFTDPSVSSFHQSSTAGDSVTFTFPSFSSTVPLSISVLGIMDFLNGLYNVSLISSLPGVEAIHKTYNGSFDWVCGSELFVASGLNSPFTDGNLTLSITNLENKPLFISALNVTTASRTIFSSSSSSTSTPTTSPSVIPDASNSQVKLSLPAGTLAALIISSFCALGLLLVGIFICLMRRRRRQRQRNGSWPPATEPKAAVNTGAVLTEKSKSTSSDSVLDIGRPLNTRRSLSESLRDITGDRFTGLRRSGRLSLPRTAITASDRNGLTGNGTGGPAPLLAAGFSQPYSNYTYPGPSRRGHNSPFVFSFDTSSGSNSNPRSQEPSDSSSRGVQAGGDIRRIRSDGSVYPISERERMRSNTLTKLTGAGNGGDASSTFLDMDQSRPQTTENQPEATRERSQRPDVPTAVRVDSPSEGSNSSTNDRSRSPSGYSSQRPPQVVTDAMHARRHSPPRIYSPLAHALSPPPLRSPPRSPPPTHPPPSIPPLVLPQSDNEVQSPMTLQLSDLPASDSGRSSGLHPYVYGYAYQPSFSGASEEGSRSRPGSEQLPLPVLSAAPRPSIAHPYAQPTTPISNPPSSPSSYGEMVNRDEVQHVPEESDHDIVGEMVFARPHTERTERLRPPGIELGELRPHHDHDE